MKHGIYIHVPFCRKKCDYCAFYSIPVEGRADREELIGSYMARLRAEYHERLPGPGIQSADTIYFGGGTPSLLSPGQINAIIQDIAGLAALDTDTEVTLEINPDDVSDKMLRALKDAGINRFSLGVQTLVPRLHREIGRSAGLSNDNLLRQFFSLKGVTRSVDIISGIPGQTSAEARHDIEALTSWSPEHISAYILSIETDTPYAQRRSPTPEHEERQRSLFELTIAELTSRGYEQYEISNFCLPGFESRHNIKYWRFAPYIGLGPGAHSFTGGERYHNPPSIDAYLSGQGPVLEIRKESAPIVEYIMTGLRLRKGIRLYDMGARVNTPIPAVVHERILDQVEKGDLLLEGEGDEERIHLSSDGLFFADRVIYSIVEPLL